MESLSSIVGSYLTLLRENWSKDLEDEFFNRLGGYALGDIINELANDDAILTHYIVRSYKNGLITPHDLIEFAESNYGYLLIDTPIVKLIDYYLTELLTGAIVVANATREGNKEEVNALLKLSRRMRRNNHFDYAKALVPHGDDELIEKYMEYEARAGHDDFKTGNILEYLVVAANESDWHLNRVMRIAGEVYYYDELLLKSSLQERSSPCKHGSST